MRKSTMIALHPAKQTNNLKNQQKHENTRKLYTRNVKREEKGTCNNTEMQNSAKKLRTINFMLRLRQPHFTKEISVQTRKHTFTRP